MNSRALPMISRRMITLGLIATAAVTSCKTDKVTGPAVATVTVSLTKTTLFTGESATATAVLNDADGQPILGRTVTWSSGTQSVATVSSSGAITAVGPGTSVITATSEGKSGTATVTVIAPVATVQVNLSAQSVTVGSTVQAAVVLKDAAGNTLSGRTVVWTSSSQSVATVSAGGP